MKTLIIFSLFLGISQAIETVNLVDKSENITFDVISDPSRSFGTPQIYQITLSGPPYNIHVKWHPVPSTSSNLVLGYQVALWEQRTETVLIWDYVDGVLQVVDQKEVLVPFPSPTEVPNWQPSSLLTLPASFNSADFPNLKAQIWYEIRVRAYTISEIGEYSPMMRIMI